MSGHRWRDCPKGKGPCPTPGPQKSFGENYPRPHDRDSSAGSSKSQTFASENTRGNKPGSSALVIQACSAVGKDGQRGTGKQEEVKESLFVPARINGHDVVNVLVDTGSVTPSALIPFGRNLDLIINLAYAGNIFWQMVLL